jgi:branched-chain amino acid transport system permease protein
VGLVIYSGLTLGGIYALVAAGFTLAFLPTGVFNFAQGAIVVGGSFLAYQWLAQNHLPIAGALALNSVVGAALGAVCELVTVRPLTWRRTDIGSNAIITTVGASTALI